MKSYTIEMQQKPLFIMMLKNQLEMVKFYGKYKSSLSQKLISLATHNKKFIHIKEQVHVGELQMSTKLVFGNFNDIS